VTEFIGFVGLILILGVGSYLIYHRPVDAARRALHEALERGDIRPEQYAAHIRALDDAA